jgi:hypothetical protein
MYSPAEDGIYDKDGRNMVTDMWCRTEHNPYFERRLPLLTFLASSFQLLRFFPLARR